MVPPSARPSPTSSPTSYERTPTESGPTCCTASARPAGISRMHCSTQAPSSASRSTASASRRSGCGRDQRGTRTTVGRHSGAKGCAVSSAINPAEVYAMVDWLGDVGCAPDEADTARLEGLYHALRLKMVHEPAAEAVEPATIQHREHVRHPGWLT